MESQEYILFKIKIVNNLLTELVDAEKLNQRDNHMNPEFTNYLRIELANLYIELENKLY